MIDFSQRLFRRCSACRRAIASTRPQLDARLSRAAAHSASGPLRRRRRARAARWRCNRRRASTRPTGRCKDPVGRARSTCCRCAASMRSAETDTALPLEFLERSSSAARRWPRRRPAATLRRRWPRCSRDVRADARALRAACSRDRLDARAALAGGARRGARAARSSTKLAGDLDGGARATVEDLMALLQISEPDAGARAARSASSRSASTSARPIRWSRPCATACPWCCPTRRAARCCRRSCAIGDDGSRGRLRGA